MIKLSEKVCKKLLVLFGGGYNSDSSIFSYYNILCGLLNKKNYIKDKEIPDNKVEEVKRIVNELKKILSPYWDF